MLILQSKNRFLKQKKHFHSNFLKKVFGCLIGFLYLTVVFVCKCAFSGKEGRLKIILALLGYD
jgi:hypothetical protein